MLNYRVVLNKAGKIIVFSFLIFFLFSLSFCPERAAALKKPVNLNRILQPYGPFIEVEDLVDWEPSQDPDAKYNQANISLKKRFAGPNFKQGVNPEAKIMSIALTNADTKNAPARGTDSFSTYSFSYWQYLDTYVYWAGLVPTADIINAAHKNGVPVLGTIGFPWGQGKGYVKRVRDFLQQDQAGEFIAANKLIEIADFYGFDGYFFNQESYGTTAADSEKLIEFISYLKAKKPELIISWYDSMINQGPVAYQDALNDKNDHFFQKNGAKIADQFFLNYNWNQAKIEKSVQTAKKHQRSPYAVYAGLDVQQNSYLTEFRVEELLDTNSKLKVSLGLFAPNSTLFMAQDPLDFYKKESIFWLGSAANLDSVEQLEEQIDWPGMASFVSTKSAIRSKPFVSNFNTGQGKKYFIAGKLAKDSAWNNRSLQEYLPTWRWQIDSVGPKLKAGFDFEDAYNGGSSLKLIGDLAAKKANIIALYKTKLDINQASYLTLTYKSPIAAADLELGLSLKPQAQPKDYKFFDLKVKGDNQWQQVQLPLKSIAGQRIYAVALKVKAKTKIENYKLNLGQIKIYDQAKIQPIKAPAEINIDRLIYQNAQSLEARISWPKLDNPNLAFYELYRVKTNQKEEFIGATYNNAYYISKLQREKNTDKVKIKLVPVSQNYKRGKAAYLNFAFKIPRSATEIPESKTRINLALAKKVRASAENKAEPAAKAVDGTVANNSKWCVTNAEKGWLEIKLDQPQQVQRWRVEHAEAGGETKLMNTRDFKLQVSADKGKTYQDLDQVKNNESMITDRNLKEAVTAQYFRLWIDNSGESPWGAIRIYEFQLYKEPKVARTNYIPLNYAQALNNKGAQDEFILENIVGAQTVHLYQSLDSQKPFLSQAIDPNDSSRFKLDNLNFGSKAGRIYYTVQAETKAESIKMSTAYEAEK